MGDLFPTAVAGMLVMAQAWGRFAAPGISQVSTTRLQLYASRGAYTLTVLAVYAALAKAIAASAALAGLLAGGASLAPGAAALLAPYAAALIMTTLLPNLPGVAKIDEFVLEFFHALGGMPACLDQLASLLKRSPYVAAGPFQRSIVDYIQGSFIPDSLIDELRFVASDSARARFTRNVSLYVEIQHLKAGPGFQRFFEKFSAETAEFERGFGKFIAQATAFFAFSAQVPADRQRALESVREARIAFKTQCAEFNELLALFLARALLRNSWVSGDLEEHLKNLGFAATDFRPLRSRPLRIMATIGVYLVLLFMVGIWSPPW